MSQNRRQITSKNILKTYRSFIVCLHFIIFITKVLVRMEFVSINDEIIEET